MGRSRRCAATVPSGLTNDTRREVPSSLDLVVRAVATKLMAAGPATATQVYELVLADLVDRLDADKCFLRYHNQEISASVLVAEWPPRFDKPDPDPLAVLYFDVADPLFARVEQGEPSMAFVVDPDDYPGLIEAGGQIEGGGRIPATTIAVAPLVSVGTTTGVVGLVNFSDREWKPEELGALEAIASLFAQVQARLKAEEELLYFADHDDLTGLYNRRALLAHLQHRLVGGQSGPVSALFVNLDRLKTINDYLGHAAGDWFIRVFAKRLREGAGSGDFIARLGGDEFVVIPASPIDRGAAESLAYRLESLLTERVYIDGEVLTRSVSIGVASGVPGRDSNFDLLNRADQAVIMAKSAGGNQIAVLSADMSLSNEFRNDIELHMHDAISNNVLVLRYLPEIDMRTGQILGTEALVRWPHPTRGLLSPGAFIDVAESINAAGELGRWVLRSACAEFGSWRASGLGQQVQLRINVSPVQLVTDGFVELVADTIHDCGLDGGSICLEITENVVVQDIETTLRALKALKAVGVDIALDDFGTGYSVLSHLKLLPVDALKIDRNFVRELGVNAGDLAIVRAIIALARAFGLEPVAEGVETESAATTLLRYGCFRAQGFLFSHPVAGHVMKALLAQGRLPVRFSGPREPAGSAADPIPRVGPFP